MIDLDPIAWIEFPGDDFDVVEPEFAHGLCQERGPLATPLDQNELHVRKRNRERHTRKAASATKVHDATGRAPEPQRQQGVDVVLLEHRPERTEPSQIQLGIGATQQEMEAPEQLPGPLGMRQAQRPNHGDQLAGSRSVLSRHLGLQLAGAASEHRGGSDPIASSKNATARASEEARAAQRSPGDVLLSHAVSHAVPSTLEGLTSEFGMGSGRAPPPWSPGREEGFETRH